MSIKSKRQKIVDAQDARFKQISKSAGYMTEIGSGHEWWVIPALDDEELPKVCFKDTDRTEWFGFGSHMHSLTTFVEIYLAPDRATAAETVRKVIADITTCIGQDVSWGGLAEDTGIPDETDIKIEERATCLAAIGLNFTITFLTEPFNAYE